MALLRLLLSPAIALAQQQQDQPRFVVITTGIRIPFTQAIGNLTGFIAATSVGVCTLLFIIGAAQMTLSHGDQTAVDNGKKLMISSLVGLAIVLGSYAIIRTVLFFLYEGAA